MGKGLMVFLTVVLGAGLCCLVLFVYESEPSLEHHLRHLYLLTTRASHYWHKFKHHPRQIISQSNSIIKEGAEEDMEDKKLGKEEKVKEAMEKSFEKTKSTVEDSAKSAAKIAGDAVETVKESITERSPLTDPRDEL